MNTTQAIIMLVSYIFFLPTAFFMLWSHCFKIKPQMLKVKVRTHHSERQKK